MVASEASLLLEYFASQKLANRHKHSSGIHADHLKGGAKVEGRKEEPPVCRTGRRIDAKTRMGMSPQMTQIHTDYLAEQGSREDAYL
jgi:hypothetical protein